MIVLFITCAGFLIFLCVTKMAEETLKISIRVVCQCKQRKKILWNSRLYTFTVSQKVNILINNGILKSFNSFLKKYGKNYLNGEIKWWVLHQNNAKDHTTSSVRVFLAKYKILVLQHAPYSSDITPCVFNMSPKVKSALKGTRFQITGALNEKADASRKSSQKKSSSTVSNYEKFACSIVELKEWCTLKR